jgi:hypothetical protein
VSALLETIKDTLSTERQKARRLYAAIVRRDGTPDARSGDAADLRKAMQTLGFSEETLARDRAAIAESKRLAESIPADADGLADALAARQADRQREGAECRAKRRDLMEQFRTAAERERTLEAEAAADETDTHRRIDDVQDARARLAQLRRSHALVLGNDE